jgi:hypothetical protein
MTALTGHRLSTDGHDELSAVYGAHQRVREVDGYCCVCRS